MINTIGTTKSATFRNPRSYDEFNTVLGFITDKSDSRDTIYIYEAHYHDGDHDYLGYIVTCQFLDEVEAINNLNFKYTIENSRHVLLEIRNMLNSFQKIQYVHSDQNGYDIYKASFIDVLTKVIDVIKNEERRIIAVQTANIRAYLKKVEENTNDGDIQMKLLY